MSVAGFEDEDEHEEEDEDRVEILPILKGDSS